MKQNELQQQQGRLRGILSNIILMLVLGIIGILAVPTVLLIGSISIIWSAADRIIRWIEN